VDYGIVTILHGLRFLCIPNIFLLFGSYSLHLKL
jgi:hypothetical protein